MKRIVIVLLALLISGAAHAVETTITYQGTLDDGGVPANGSYDFSFQLRNIGGGAVTAAVVREDVAVVGGLFTVPLNFGNSFPGADRLLGISVRPGASSGAFTALSPDVILRAAPYALYSNEADYAEFAGLALNVADNSVDAVDINTNAVTSDKIAADAVGSSELANNSVGIDNLIGAQFFNAVIGGVSLSGNDCGTFDIPMGGGFEVSDIVIVNVAGTLPSNMTIAALGVPTNGTVRFRICNHGTTTQSFTSMPLNVISIR